MHLIHVNSNSWLGKNSDDFMSNEDTLKISADSNFVLKIGYLTQNN